MKTKIRDLFCAQKVLALAGLLLLIGLSLASPLRAQTLTQGYGADEKLQRGMIVKLKDGDDNKVEAAATESAEKIRGIVVGANDAPFTLSAEGEKVFIASVGKFDVLVSGQAGPIRSGDYITASAIRGIGMKAGSNEPLIIGRAIGEFDGNSNVISSAEVKIGDSIQAVNISRVQVELGIASNPHLKTASSNMPEAVRRTADTLAGKPVSAARVYLALALLSVSTIIALTLMYGGIRSAIISIGRNPLSRKSVVKGMVQVILSGLIIFISGIFGVYLLLKL